jgi:FtsH-binding integral membrane protein
MKGNYPEKPNSIFKLANRILRYYLWMLFGLAISLVLSWLLALIPVIVILSSFGFWEWVLKLGVLICCLFAIAIIVESSQ